jgi:predicted SAM-dependent methyltransferase
LLKKLPFEDSYFDFIYCSRFLEHIPLNQVEEFLKECRRVLELNGIIPLVLPDLENIVREYLFNLSEGNKLFAEFNVVEIIDQYVRNKSGEELINWYSKARKQLELKDYISMKTGHSFKTQIETKYFMLAKIKKLT